jgi:hydroxymethylbilane synthase
MSAKIRIGTRESALALWQARFIQDELKKLGAESELVLIKSDGELNLTTPLYEMGVQGIFTKALDIALLDNQIDIAVHSLKDVPTQLAKGLALVAVPERGNTKDVLVYKDKLPDLATSYLVATSSLRRSAQWLHKFPQHQTTVLRGNINTRLKKLNENKEWNGALFAAAGIERINLEVPHKTELEWMVPAPAQGALGVLARANDDAVKEICKPLNHTETYLSTSFERNFLRKLMGGCSMPIGGLAKIENQQLHFTGCVLTLDGKKMSKVVIAGDIENVEFVLNKAVEELLNNGGREIVATYKK